jgi:hypothetical protein
MKNIVKLCLFFLILGFFIPYPASALEAPDTVRVYVDDVEIAPDAGTATKVESTSDIEIRITRPAGTIEKFVYEWNESSGDAGLHKDSSNSIPNPSETAIDTINGSFFSGSDWDNKWYFHVKAIGIGEESSVESVFGPYHLDAVGPVTSTIKLKNIPGQQYPDSNQTVSSTVTFEINSTPDLNWVYLSNTSNKAQAIQEYIDPLNVTYPYALSEFVTAPSDGKATVHAWFEDEAGNIWYTSIDLTITEGKTMDPTGNLTLGIGDDQNFQITGAGSESYTWTVVDAENTSLGSDAATISPQDPTSTAVLTADSEGTVRVKAETAGADPIFSGVITVEQRVTIGDVNDDGIIDSGDAILVLRYSVGLITLTDAQKHAGNVTNKADNESIDSGDAIKILRYSVGLITEF